VRAKSELGEIRTDVDATHIDQLDKALGLSIRLRRQLAGCSQSDLGEAIGVSFQQIQKYERGVNRVSFSKLILISRALKCSIDDLVAEIEELDLAPRTAGSIGELLAQPEAVHLLEALAQIKAPQLRRAVVDLARSLSQKL
jgi:transcriptional regulator with XRE-family HTH domain